MCNWFISTWFSKVSVKICQIIIVDNVIPFEGGKQRQMSNFKFAQVCRSGSVSKTVQMVGKGLTAVGKRLQSFVIFEEGLKVEILERQILDVLRVLIDQEVCVLSQNSDGVDICELGNDLQITQNSFEKSKPLIQ